MNIIFNKFSVPFHAQGKKPEVQTTKYLAGLQKDTFVSNSNISFGKIDSDSSKLFLTDPVQRARITNQILDYIDEQNFEEALSTANYVYPANMKNFAEYPDLAEHLGNIYLKIAANLFDAKDDDMQRAKVNALEKAFKLKQNKQDNLGLLFNIINTQKLYDKNAAFETAKETLILVDKYGRKPQNIICTINNLADFEDSGKLNAEAVALLKQCRNIIADDIEYKKCYNCDSLSVKGELKLIDKLDELKNVLYPDKLWEEARDSIKEKYSL